MKRPLVAALLGSFALAMHFAPDLSPGQPQPSPKSMPQYTKDGNLLRPDDYRTWVFVGSNIGISYTPRAAANTLREKDAYHQSDIGNFHNVYINPEAYSQYARSGTFPEGTMLVMDVYQAKSREPQGIVTRGFYPAEQVGLEVAVKNSKRPDGQKTDWAYYVFDNPGGPLKSSARASPNRSCYDCHLKHASDDNVWVQFYPTLRRLKKPAP
jgi:hypothetical protein